MRGSGPEGDNIDKMVLGSSVGASSTASEVTNAAMLDSISFTKLSICSAINSLSTLLGDLELLETRGEDVWRADGLIVLDEHTSLVDASLKRAASSIEGFLGLMVGSLEVQFIKSGSKEAVFSSMNMRTSKGDRFPRDVSQDSTGPVPNGGRTRV